MWMVFLANIRRVDICFQTQIGVLALLDPVERTMAAAIVPFLSGVYNINNAMYQSHPIFTSGYGQGPDVQCLHCSSFEQSRLFSNSCGQPGSAPLTSPTDKHYRMYPWMRAPDPN